MKLDLQNINKAFESKIRLGIMSALSVNDKVDFTTLKSILDTSDGNIASHTRHLETLGYIMADKQFINRKPNTSFSITPLGKQMFTSHIKALAQLLNTQF